MEDLLITATRNTPAISLKSDTGEILFQGKCVPENSIKLFQPVFDWLKDFKAASVTINLKLEYLNTASINQLFKLLKLLSENPAHEKILVNWYYEQDDEDIRDEGEYFATLLKNIEFKFIEFAEN